MAFEFTLTQAVQQVCEKLGDDEYTRWSDTTNYGGRACIVFLESINELIDLYADFVKRTALGQPVEPVRTTELDFYGIIARYEATIGTTGVIVLADVIDNIKEVLQIYPDPDGTDHLEYNLQRIDEEFMNGCADQSFGPAETIRWYTNSNSIVFQPKVTFASGTHKIYIKYIQYCTLLSDGTSKSIDLLTYYTKNVVDLAVQMAYEKLMQEELRRGQ